MLTYMLFKTQTKLLSEQAGQVSQMPTYILFKCQTMLLSATSRQGQSDADLQPVQNPGHGFISDK